MNKARLTYRFDRENDPRRKEAEAETPAEKVVPLYEDEFHVVGGEQPLEQTSGNAYGKWDSPYDAETKRIEQLIRETTERKERAARQPAVARPAAPVAPDYEDYERHEPETGYYDREQHYSEPRHRELEYGAPDYGARYVRRPNHSWWKVTASVTGALVTGILLGFFVLDMFNKQGTSDVPSSGKSPTTQTASAGTAGGKAAPSAGQGTAKTDSGAAAGKTEETTLPASAGAAATAGVNLPARSYTFLQSGGFGTEQAAKTLAADLQKMGIAAVTEQGDKFYVYVGIAASKEMAAPVVSLLTERKVEIYSKPVTLPAASKVRWNGKTDTLASYLSQSDQLVQMMSGLTLIHLEESKPTPLDNATVQSIQKSFDAWKTASAGLGEGAPAEAKTTLQRMDNAMQTAKQSLDEYKKTPSSGMLWQTQNYLLQFVIAEKELLKTVAAM